MPSNGEKKNYIKGSAKIFEFSNGGHKLNVSLHVDSLADIANEKGYANIEIYSNYDGEEDKFGNTHYIVENTYKKDGGSKGGGKSPKKKTTKSFSPVEKDDDLPW